MWIGNCFLLILNVPLVRFWLSIFKIPYSVLFRRSVLLLHRHLQREHNLDDVFITASFGLLGYVLMRLS